MPFKKQSNNSKKNKTKKQQKKNAPASKSTANDDASSVEEIITQTTEITEAAITEVEPETILTEEELQALEEKRRAEEEAERAHQEYMRVNYYVPAYQEWRKKWEDSMIADLEDPEYYEYRIEQLERSREKYNKKMSWSAEDMEQIDAIDEEIKTAEKMIDQLCGIEEEPPKYNAILGGADWWKTDDNQGWVSSR